MGVAGTIITIAIGLFLIYLVVSGLFFNITNLTANNHQSRIEITTTRTSGSLASTASSGAPLDSMSLTLLGMLSFDNSTNCGGLLDGQYWNTVLKTSGNTTVHIIPGTIYGLQQSASEWTRFFEQNMSNPPAWLSLGLGNYTQGLED